MQKKHILIVEDEAAIREMLLAALQRADFKVSLAANAQEARLVMAHQANPHLVLLDWMMPGLSGVDFARELKAGTTTKDIPIIMLTARAEEEDKVRGLNLGCDDYINKPFSLPELIARIQAVLRRTRSVSETEQLEFNNLQIDVAGQRVTVDGQIVKLGPTEYRLLHFFATHAERVYSREQLLDRVWGQNVYIEERTVDVHIRRLRQALEAHGQGDLVQTVRGAGYRFSPTK